ncbi:MAG: sn-glycerol-3-phosphate ABC transporter ATP-binding protein UgpC [Candidatus Omnitrophica bacterium]|nr:sn-glycerol-3-phosphate ABC transporter ATP-binding protein UgpC [Candidatus Omnitrophota bacterium]
MAQVSLRNVSKVFPGGVEAVKDVSLGVEDKEFLVILGPSGCGKSTTLRVIAGLEEATNGDVFIADKRVNDIPPKDRDIAMVFQNYALYPHMNVYNNMAFGLRLRNYPKPEIDGRVRDAAGILGLAKLLDRKPRELSGGQRQRVAVGRAIVRKPLVFLFDEPLSNLDAKMRMQMRTEIHRLHIRLQSTMIYVTHDQTEAMTLGDRIVVMNEGVMQQVGSPIEIYDKPVNKFVADFIGSPPMNFIEGTVVSKDSKLYFNEKLGKLKVKIADGMTEKLLPSVNKEIIFGIRSEDIYDKLFASNASVDNTVTMACEVVEPMGSEAYLHLSSGKHTLIAKVGAHNNPPVNQDMDFVFDMQKVHFFDKHTGDTII